MSPTFLPKKTIQQVSRPLKNPVFYENGFGGVLARPFANPRGSGGFEWLQSLESVLLTMAPNYDSLDSLPLQTGNTSPSQIPIPSNSLFRKNPNGSYNRRLPWMVL